MYSKTSKILSCPPSTQTPIATTITINLSNLNIHWKPLTPPPLKKSMHEQGYVLSSLCFLLIPLCTPSGINSVHDCCFCINDCLSCIGVGFVKEAVDFLFSCSVSYFSIFLKISCLFCIQVLF